MEKTLIVLKPDAIQKNLVGEIISRFEKASLKILGMKMIHPDEDFAKGHYPLDEEWSKQVFEKTKASYDKRGEEIPEKDHIELGEKIQSYLIKFLTESPVVAMVVEGENAIEEVRKMLGATEPKSAEPGTIRGDLASEESYQLADSEKRAIKNLVHASDSAENAAREISYWFSESELYGK